MCARGNSENSEQRRSYRCQIPDERQEATLKVGRRRFRVRLFNESAGGFAAWLQCDPKLEVDDLVELSTDAGSIEARVAHIAQVDLVAKGAPSHGVVFRVGLERLEGTPEKQSLWARRRAWLTQRPQRVFASKGALVATVIVLLGAAVLGAAGVLERLDRSRVPQSLGSDKQPEARLAPDGPTLADAARELTLTVPQQERIHQLVEQAGSELAQLDAQWAQDGPAERSRKRALLLDAVRREIDERLSRSAPSSALPNKDE